MPTPPPSCPYAGRAVAQYYYGVEFAPKDLRLGLIQAASGKIGNLVDEVLLYCYHYDPATGNTARWSRGF